MSLADDRNKIFDNLLKEYEKAYESFMSGLNKVLPGFIRGGPHTKSEVSFFIQEGGLNTMANEMVSKYGDVIEYTQQVSRLTGIPVVLPQRSAALLTLFKENKVADVLGSAENIINSVTEASFRHGIGEVPLNTIIKDLRETIKDQGRRLITEAHTGANMYERSVKFQQFENAGVELYFYDGPSDSRNREECSSTLSDSRQGTGWTMADIQGSATPFIACGGYNCRHEWLPFIPELDAEIERMYGKIAGPIEED
jgi:hypothetical protein